MMLRLALITGPAVLTTCLVLANTYGLLTAAAALVINIALVGVLFSLARPIANFFGRTGTKMLSKVSSLLLAAFAVMLMRRGVLEIWLSVSQ